MHYKVKDIVKCKVVGIQPYGAFVELEDQRIQGLIHISEISNEFISDVEDHLKVGDEIKARIISINEDERQLSLSLTKLPKHERELLDNFKEKPEFEIGFDSLKVKLEEWLEELEEEYDCKI